MSEVRPMDAGGSRVQGRALAETIAKRWGASGLDGAFLARNPASGDWLGFGLDRVVPVASVIKVPIALAALELIRTGELDPDERHHIDPPSTPEGATGLAVFGRPAEIAAADLLYLMLAFSDNRAADRIIDLIGIERLQQMITDWGLSDLHLRHRMADLFGTAVGLARDDFSLAMELAIDGALPDERHRISTLDARLANVGTARALADLLERVWADEIADPSTTARLRQLMGRQPDSHRLAAELRSDNVSISGKTGTYLNLRHEIGVAETADGQTVVLVALTRSSVPAFVQPGTDAAIAAAARDAFDLLRA